MCHTVEDVSQTKQAIEKLDYSCLHLYCHYAQHSQLEKPVKKVLVLRISKYILA